MGDRGKFQPQFLVLEVRPLRTEVVLLHEQLAVATAVIRGDLHAHLLRAFLPTLLRLVHEAGDLLGKIEQWRTLMGGILGPMEAWLALRSIPTLPLRMEKTCANAQAIAEFLTTRPEVEKVMYPGLKTHPGHEIAARQMRYFGPVVSFVLRDKAAAERFLAKAELLTDATSFGGVITTAERRARWGGDAIAEGFIRLSAGCEEAEDLIADIGQALDAVR